MLRTLQTAQIIGGILDLAPHVFVGLHEWAGVWQFPGKQGSAQLYGLTRGEISAMFPGFVLSGEVTDRGWWFYDWDGDRAMLDLARRNALSFIRYLETHHVEPEQRVAAILHGGSGSSLVGALFSVPQDVKYARFTHANTGISRVSITPQRRQLRFLNRTDHLRVVTPRLGTLRWRCLRAGGRRGTRPDVGFTAGDAEIILSVDSRSIQRCMRDNSVTPASYRTI